MWMTELTNAAWREAYDATFDAIDVVIRKSHRVGNSDDEELRSLRVRGSPVEHAVEYLLPPGAQLVELSVVERGEERSE